MNHLLVDTYVALYCTVHDDIIDDAVFHRRKNSTILERVKLRAN
jgi:hypothetical protein